LYVDERPPRPCQRALVCQRQDLWILPTEPSPDGRRKPIPFVVTPADETFGQFSSDGRWIATGRPR
jgi:hypothetical protein